MPKKKFQLLSAEEAEKLLEFFEKNEHLIINSEPNQDLLKIILKIHLNSCIVNVGLPKYANIKEASFRVSLADGGKEKLKLFLQEQ